MTLDEIAIKNGTDKATLYRHPDGSDKNLGHGYAPIYDRFFSPLRESDIRLIEIGVGGGESISTWLEYFPRAQVIGVDTSEGTCKWNTAGPKVHERYTFIKGDQGHPKFWEGLINVAGKDWDIIIDDGGHYSAQIVTTWNCLWPQLKPGGIYCIEDLGVDKPGSLFLSPGFPRHMEFVRGIAEKVNSGDGVASVHCFKELAIIEKLT